MPGPTPAYTSSTVILVQSPPKVALTTLLHSVQRIQYGFLLKTATDQARVTQSSLSLALFLAVAAVDSGAHDCKAGTDNSYSTCADDNYRVGR